MSFLEVALCRCLTIITIRNDVCAEQLLDCNFTYVKLAAVVGLILEFDSRKAV